MLFAEKSILTSANRTDYFALLDLQAAVAELQTRLTIATEAADEEKLKLHESVNFGVEANGLNRSLEEVYQTQNLLLMDSQA